MLEPLFGGFFFVGWLLGLFVCIGPADPPASPLHLARNKSAALAVRTTDQVAEKSGRPHSLAFSFFHSLPASASYLAVAFQGDYLWSSRPSAPTRERFYK